MEMGKIEVCLVEFYVHKKTSGELL